VLACGEGTDGFRPMLREPGVRALARTLAERLEAAEAVAA